jgi:hypothetical protein
MAPPQPETSGFSTDSEELKAPVVISLIRKMHLTEKHKRHMCIKTSPMQNERLCCHRFGQHENVQEFMVMLPLTKVLPESFSRTYALLKR